VSVTTTAEYTDFIKQQADIWAKVIKTANIKAD